ncbi:hypothetical protein F441_19420 [Phytophthora nicotianae CJ01A1]|uniref:Helitron helicase-like domain-containing protein n=2 Tax=Phytophthora nicotianae TaxID=4792 RepID=W2W202_PHYNI|nr:hypothetical protein F441_19420 [Phytophthora nicotianae CJ01A1]
MACARYYNAIVRLLIDVLLNYAQDRQCSRPRSGGFGKTKAYFLSTESQNSTGDLHGHMLVWIENMPTTTAQYYELLKHRDFQHRVQDYVSSIASSSFPVSLDRCSSCSSTDIAAMQFSREVFKKPKRELNILQEAERLHVSQDRMNDASVFRIISMPQSLPLSPPGCSEENLLVTKALLNYQTHDWNHARSCFKQTKRTPDGKICRMFFQSPLVD